MESLFQEQIEHLDEKHFLALYWVAQAEDRKVPYNITNCFDDLKLAGITRTKQNAVAAVETLSALRFLDIRGSGNRKNLFITPHGARALQHLVSLARFTPRPSVFLEGQKP